MPKKMKVDYSKDYEKSNKVVTMPKRLSKVQYAKLLSDKDRVNDAQKLLDYLCKTYELPLVCIKVTDEPRPKVVNKTMRMSAERLGYYQFCGAFSIIVIYNTTAVKHQVVSIKRFAETLLHEFMHHYDYCKLHLTKSLHTAGFYTRISELQKKLS